MQITQVQSVLVSVETLAPPSSPTLGQTEVLALLLRLEAVVIAAAAAVPEASALVLLAVVEPHHGEALAAALVLLQEAVACTGQRSAQTCTCVCVCVRGWFLPLDVKLLRLGFSSTFGSEEDRKGFTANRKLLQLEQDNPHFNQQGAELKDLGVEI